MKKLISTISLLAIVIFTNSCRSQEENFETETETLTSHQSGQIFKKTGDSIITDSANAINNPTPSDPPPKNGHQW